MNTKGRYHTVVHKAVTGHSPPSVAKRVIDKRLRYQNLRKEGKKLVSGATRRREFQPPDLDYYGDVEEPDLSEDIYNERKADFLEELSKCNNVEIQKATIVRATF